MENATLICHEKYNFKINFQRWISLSISEVNTLRLEDSDPEKGPRSLTTEYERSRWEDSPGTFPE